MGLNSRDVWGHFAPMFHLVDAFAIYAITLVGGRHVILPAFTAQEALLMIGEQHKPCTCAQASNHLHATKHLQFDLALPLGIMHCTVCAVSSFQWCRVSFCVHRQASYCQLHAVKMLR